MSTEVTRKNGAPVLDDRDADALGEALLKRLPGYVPGWEPTSGSASWAVIHIYARYLHALSERIGLAPDKNKLAFLDMVGLNLLPAQAARAPLVFKAMSDIGDSRVPARSQVGATAGEETLIFETENAIALAAAQLVEVYSLWPGKDAYADHSPETMGASPFTLFKSTKAVPHEIYLAHDTLFALSGEARVELQFDLARPGSKSLSSTWEYWDGEVWRAFKAFKEPGEAGDVDSIDGTQGFRRSGIIRLVADCAETKKTTVQGVEAFWIRGRTTQAIPPEPGLTLPLVSRISARTVVEVEGLSPDAAYANGLELDLSKSFFPFGQQPQPGTTFYFASEEAFSKPKAAITLDAVDAETPQEEEGGPATKTPGEMVGEYWDGKKWRSLSLTGNLGTFISEASVSLEFEVPAGMTARKVNDQEGWWARIRIVKGGFTRTNSIQWTDPGDADTSAKTNTVTIVETVPPALDAFTLSYLYESPWEAPAWCFTYNDLQWADDSGAARWRGNNFEPFKLVEDRTPTLYLGFNRPLPAGLISLYLEVEEEVGRAQGNALRWDYYDGTQWSPVTVEDETADLALPGMVGVVYPGTKPKPSGEVVLASGTVVELANAQQAAKFQAGQLLYIGEPEKGELVTVASISGARLTTTTPVTGDYQRAPVSLAMYPRFGQPRTWLRARMQSDGEPHETQIKGIYPNAVWASQTQTLENEVLGSGNGQANQAVFCRETPVLDGEVVEVRELEGARAAVEWPILEQELLNQGLARDVIRLVKDARSGEIREVWVRWSGRPNFFFSGPEDRHYLIERSRGRIMFGDGENGRLPPAGTDNILLRSYRAGGGQGGNVTAGDINQLLSGVLAESVTNPVAAEGGADGEPVEDVRLRGPQAVRHHMQAISLGDYEALAREASPAVAVARALPTTHSSGRPAAGWVRLIIMPQSQDPQPQPSFGLRRQVQNYLAARVPAAISEQIFVTGPTYLPIGVEAVVAPADVSAAGAVFEEVTETLEAFLHPLTGGPEGTGWPFGRDVYLSDVAAVLEAVEGVDYVETLNLLLDNTPRGERIDVPEDRIVVAGEIDIKLAG